MRHKERIDVKNIREKEIVKVVSIGQKDVRFRLQNAYVGQVGDNTELLDETLVDNMLELMAKAVKTNYSKYNPVPNEIIIRNTMSEKKEDKPADNKESQDMIESYEPRFALEQVALNEKVKEQQAGKKQYLWIAELVAAGAATIICGAAVIRTAIPYNGALSWKIDEWRRIIDESSSNANSDINKEENEPAISDEAETETETKTSENIRNSDTWEFNAEDGDMYYFINDITGYRLNVVDAACGSRFYNFEKTKDGGTTWTEVNGDPFDQNMGVAEGLLFFTNDFGFAGLTYASEDFSMLYVTKDGGETFERLELPLDTVTELPSEAAELGFTIEDYDYHTMPQIVDGKMEIYLQTDAMEQQGIIFQSEDNGVTWEYAGCKE